VPMLDVREVEDIMEGYLGVRLGVG
jgi:hypothetical protein